MSELIPPYGGRLVTAEPSGAERRELAARAARLPSLPVADVTLAHMEAIATGVYSPLTGFMGERDCRSVVERLRLADGRPWPWPVVLPVPEEWARRRRAGEEVALLDSGGRLMGVLGLEDLFRPDPRWKAAAPDGEPLPLGRPDAGVMYAGGPVRLLQRRPARFPRLQQDPVEVRATLAGRGWRAVAGILTRHVIHKDGEYVLRTLLEGADGVLVQGVVADADEPRDIPARVRVRCYEVVLHQYFPAHRVHLVVQGVSEPLGSPRRALLGAIVLRNYGCTQAAVTAEAAGAEEAGDEGLGLQMVQELYERFQDELGIRLTFFTQPLFCDACGTMVTDKTCPHGALERVIMNRERLRRLLLAGIAPPPQYTRPEVASILLEWARGAR
ncbi:MAG: sulfate adenylyltransferase [Firmicutes bacterium]|nr:sulfate adenylyltransferase [Bacillota bacterium]